MTAFVLHVMRDRGSCAGSVTTRRKIHLVTCKYAGRTRHAVRIDLDEVVRIRNARDTVPTTYCHHCRPYELVHPAGYPRDLACVCPHWRALYRCPVHGAAIKALEEERFNRFLRWAAAPVNGPASE